MHMTSSPSLIMKIRYSVMFDGSPSFIHDSLMSILGRESHVCCMSDVGMKICLPTPVRSRVLLGCEEAQQNILFLTCNAGLR